MITIKEDICELLHDLSAEIIFENSDFHLKDSLICFLNGVSEYIRENKWKRKNHRILKSYVLNVFNRIKEARIKLNIKTDDFENLINEFIYNSVLNRVKALPKEFNDENVLKLYNEVNEILDFPFKGEVRDDYSFWAFLKIAGIIRALYEKSRNNVLGKDLTVSDLSSSLKFSFINSDGLKAELLYKEEAIYLTVNKEGSIPLVFAFLENSENIGEFKNKTFNKDGKEHILFSGVFSLEGFMPENTFDISLLLSKIADYESAVSNPIATLEVSERISRYETERKNMLIGTVKSKEQLQINLNYNFYYMPVSQLFETNRYYDYIAIYQSQINFGEESGIEYFGEIGDIKLLRRCEITEIPRDSQEKYIRFSVKWKKRKNKINPDCYIKSFLETSYLIFKNAQNVSELYIKNYEEYKLYEFLKDNFENVKASVTGHGIYEINADDLRFELGDFEIEVLKNEICVAVFSRYELKRNFHNFIMTILKIKKEK